MKKITLLLFLTFSINAYCQKGLAFKDAPANGISVKELDAEYKSAVDTNPEKAVFTTDEDQEKLIKAYQDFLVDFGSFLLKNNFTWQENTRSFNRIYLRADGKVDYFLYDFKTPLPEAKLKEFERLLNLYIKDHDFGISANQKFAQCSPVTYTKSGD